MVELKVPRINPDYDITVGIVIFNPDRPVLIKTLKSLQSALEETSPLRAKLYIIDNSPEPSDHSWLTKLLSGLPLQIIAGHGNVGFGAANNMVLDEVGKFHLVLNPDVEMEPDALKQALAFMVNNPDTGLITPKAFNPDGSIQYLCKRYPAIFDLLLRGFAPRSIKALFRQRLDRYEMRDQIADTPFWDPPIVSGCFMFFRGDVYRQLSGFDPRYLLYFEDFDISLRAGKIAHIAYVPAVRIVHEGGHAARKGLWHIRQFARSAFIFYTTHPLKLF
jgi:GT2 family glycosyltransferase